MRVSVFPTRNDGCGAYSERALAAHLYIIIQYLYFDYIYNIIRCINKTIKLVRRRSSSYYKTWHSPTHRTTRWCRYGPSGRRTSRATSPASAPPPRPSPAPARGVARTARRGGRAWKFASARSRATACRASASKLIVATRQPRVVYTRPAARGPRPSPCRRRFRVRDRCRRPAPKRACGPRHVARGSRAVG
jgi:hypothetical protein